MLVAPLLPRAPRLTRFPLVPRSRNVKGKRTFLTPFHPVSYAVDTVSELRLRGAQLLEGSGEMLQVLRELVLEVRELGSGESG